MLWSSVLALASIMPTLLATAAVQPPGANTSLTQPCTVDRVTPIASSEAVGTNVRQRAVQNTPTAALPNRPQPTRHGLKNAAGGVSPGTVSQGAPAVANWSTAGRGETTIDTSLGTAAPPQTLGGHLMTPFGRDPSGVFTDLLSVADPCSVPGDITFSSAVNHRVIGSGWIGWSHGYTGDVYYTNDATSIRLSLPVNTCAFYFYVEPNPFHTFTFTVTTDDGAWASFDANGSGGAAYCGIYGGLIGSVTISSTIDFAVGEFGIACICDPIYRACCFEAAPPSYCVDGFDVLSCIAEGGRWDMDAEYCSQLVPACGDYRGACCEGENPDPGHVAFECIGDMLQWECLALGEATNWTGGRSCSDPTFLCPGVPGILYCPASADNSAFRAALSALIGLPVDYSDVRANTPTLETLLGYRAVFTWANYPYDDNETFGDNLADYVDAGGRVILGQWCLPTARNYLSGRIMTAEYCPALATSYGSGSYNGDGLMCPTGNVAALTTQYLDLITGLQSGAMTDGTIGVSYAAVWRPDMAVWYSPGNLGGTYESGDWSLLTYNEIICQPTDPGACCETTTTNCVDDLLVLDCLRMGAQWRWHIGLCAEMVPTCGNPGACCDIYTGLCTDNVLEALCEAAQFTGGSACGELEPECGDPGCCCNWPYGEPSSAYRANCDGRFVSLEPGEECTNEVFTPPCYHEEPNGLLYAPANGDNATFRAALAALLGERVDYVNTAEQTPTIDMISRYIAVMTWANYPYADAYAFGDYLADYVDIGGRVILGQWCLPTARNYLAGRIMTAEYCPALASSWGSGTYNNDGVQCATMDVSTLTTEYLDLITGLQPGAMTDGSIGASYAAIWRPDMAVWYSPGNLGGTYESGDWGLLTYNEVMCRNVPGPCCNVYTAECIDDLIPVLCFDMGPQWKWLAGDTCAMLEPPCGSPGACCDIHTGECVDAVLRAVCEDQGHEPTIGQQCSELLVPCGDPGCCCEAPEVIAPEPYFAYRANCHGRFLSGVLGEDCTEDAFAPPCGIPYPHGVLYAPAEPDSPEFRASLSALLNIPVDYRDARATTPTLEELVAYATVITWVDYPYADEEQMGNVLADFADYGGRVILGQWCRHSDQSNWLGGRIMSDPAYCPVRTCSTSFGFGTYNHDGTQCPTTDVGTLTAEYLDVVTGLQPEVMMDGTIGDSYAAIWNQPMSVWYSPGFTGGVYSTGDWVIMIASMAWCVTGPGACCNILTGDCIDDVFPVDCVAMGFFWRSHPEKRCAELIPPCAEAGACCDPYGGACIDYVLKLSCESLERQSSPGITCDELPTPCGDPGCCCDRPEPGVVTEPYFAFRANCDGRFIPGVYTLCGDLDASGVVDATDYGMFLDCFGKSQGQPGFVAAADLDGDGSITMVDFQIWRNCYLYQGTDCTAAAFDPECGLQVISVEILGTLPPPADQMCGADVLAFLPDPRPLFQDVTTLPPACPVASDIVLDPALNHRAIGSGWMGWSHGYTGDVYYSNGAHSVTLTMAGVMGLYFYVEPNPFQIYAFQVVVNGSVRSEFRADGSGGAAGVAICGGETSPIQTVTITSDTDFAIGEFGMTCCATTGACCFQPTGDCTDDVASSDCVPWPGWAFFPGTRCDQLDPPCGALPGACCYGEECVLQYVSQCTGEFQGAYSSCDPNPCLCADFAIDAPGQWTGSTCDAGDDCGLRTGEEMIFAVTIPYEGKWTFSLCGSDFDTYWFFGTECCTQYWSQDDSTECGTAGYTRQDLTAGTYYIDLEGYSSCGNYVLTITPPPTGACCLTDSAECTDGLLELDCAGDRFEADTLCADLVPPCGTACWDAEIVAPGTWSGTTCGMGDDCALRAGEDVIVKVVIPSDGNWQFGLCGTATTWDTYMYLGAACCQSTWYDDDGCGSALSRIQRPGLTAGTYYLDIEPYSGSVCGDFVLDVSNYEPARTGFDTHLAPRQFEQLRP